VRGEQRRHPVSLLVRTTAVIGIVTDSNSQLPPELAQRFGIEVVPLTVTLDGVPYLEGVDLDADAFYARFEGGSTPDVATSQPSPGLFAESFERLAARGADEILAVLIGSNASGTVNAARLAGGLSPVPVRIVDTGTASFGVACCAWEAAEAIAAGASVDEAADVALAVAGTVGNVFVVGALDFARAGGRLDGSVIEGAVSKEDAIPVLSFVDGAIRSVGEARTLDEACAVMAEYTLAAGPGLRVAVGVADAAAAPVYEALEDRLRGAPEIRDLIRYRIGPSVGVHTGPGTASTFFYRARS
jgi:DegV family protein with EDD domain